MRKGSNSGILIMLLLAGLIFGNIAGKALATNIPILAKKRKKTGNLCTVT